MNLGIIGACMSRTADHRDAILERLRDGTMPCDGPWPPEKADVFERWFATGMSHDRDRPRRRDIAAG